MKKFQIEASITAAKNAIYTFFVAAQFLLHISTNAQVVKGTTDNYSVQHFGEGEGLLNTITGILPDKNGFLWIANTNGVTCFNGENILPVLVNNRAYKNSFNNVASIQYKDKDTIVACSIFLKKVALIVNNRIVKIEAQQFEKQGLIFSNQRYIIPAPAYTSGNITNLHLAIK